MSIPSASVHGTDTGATPSMMSPGEPSLGSSQDTSAATPLSANSTPASPTSPGISTASVKPLNSNSPKTGGVPPISRLPTSKPRVPRGEFLANVVVFTLLTFCMAVCILLLQLPSLLVLYGPYPVLFALKPADRVALKRYTYNMYKWYNRALESIFGSAIVILVNTLAPTVLVITGDTDAITDTSQLVLMANHQIYVDWAYLWCLARLTNHHADLKILLMSVLKYMPVFGIGMSFFEFIFLKRKLAADRQTIVKLMERQKADAPKLPMMLVIFPEGTLNTPNNREVTRAFAKKTDIADDPEYVILPKGTGLFMCCDVLYPKVTRIFDVTVGYGALTAEQIPYEEYLPGNVFFSKKYPPAIHMHIQLFEMAGLPGFDGVLTADTLAKDPILAEQAAKQAAKSGGAFTPLGEARRHVFSEWVRRRFMHKDKLMEQFYQNGEFPSTEVGVSAPKPLKRVEHRVVPDPIDWIKENEQQVHILHQDIIILAEFVTVEAQNQQPLLQPLQQPIRAPLLQSSSQSNSSIAAYLAVAAVTLLLIAQALMLSTTRSSRRDWRVTSSSNTWTVKRTGDQNRRQRRLLESFNPFASESDTRPPPTDSLSSLPLELILRTLGFLPADQLVNVSGVSSLFWELSHDEGLWRALCKQAWATMKHRPVHLFPYYDYRSVIHKLCSDDCRSILADRGADLPPPLGSDDLHILRAQVSATTPDHAIYAICASKWKASFYAARLDCQRNVITEHELQSFSWYYIDAWGHFTDADTHSDTEAPQQPEATKDPMDRYPIVKFLPNGTRGPISGSRPRPCDYFISSTGHVQVSRYPRHETSRLDDGSWVIANDWVTYKSV
ncbi:hypothetical protein BASA50_009488 [Batrachochytrium salamandrivorans]|uniref:F-box domain-containing protein n=1 Tax=Batrachochytrium salamandrivorans TaxID=1357716 RepID=A0ABQ8F4A2_9FUNG|nr:hypothetical protein BASA50_009488 [Batrachochytrium salamandrivorans]